MRKNELLLLASGVTHKFSFSCQLSSQLQSSFEGKFGKIQYRIAAVVDTLNDDVSVVRQRSFTVVRAEDVVSTHDVQKRPFIFMVEMATQFRRYSSLSNSKPLCIVAALPRISFMTNERFSLNVKFVNRSYATVKKISVEFVRYEIYRR